MSERSSGDKLKTAAYVVGGVTLAVGAVAAGYRVRAHRRAEQAVQSTLQLEWLSPRTFEGDSSKPVIGQAQDYIDKEHRQDLMVVGLPKTEGLNPSVPRNGQRPAIALHDGFQWELGMLPDGETFGNGPVEDGKQLYVAAFRLGNKALHGVQMGVVEGPDFGQGIFRAGETQFVAVGDGFGMNLKYPGVPVIGLPEPGERQPGGMHVIARGGSDAAL